MKILTGLLFFLLTTLTAAAQVSSQKLAEQLHSFEADWLKANLNSDEHWRQRFVDRKLAVTTADRSVIDKRALGVSAILDPTLAANEMKVRIAGTVTLITNNHLKDRSFRFLDTFNKKVGKWEIVATGMTRTDNASSGIDKKSVETELIDLENALSAAGNDRSDLDALIAPEFVGTSADGGLKDRSAWFGSFQDQKLKNARVGDIAVHMVSDNVAIVTGVDVATATSGKGDETVGKYRFTHTWLNRDGRWQLAASQLTHIP